jgi:glutathione S-transferase
MLYLSEMRIAHDKKHIDLRKQEHLSTDYRRINPDGLVPTLVDAGEVICGSTDIMRYLDDKYVAGKQSLSPMEKNQVVEFCYQLEKLHDPYLRTLSYHLLFISRDISAEKKQVLLKLAADHPNQARGEFLKDAVLQQFDAHLIKQSYAAIDAFVMDLDILLKHGKGEYLFADKYTMADAASLATLFRLKKLNLPIQSNRVEQYYLQNQQRDSFKLAGIQ